MSAQLELVTYPSRRLKALLPFPQRDANKYTRGVLYIVGGSAHYPGAVCMAADAAYKIGAGYVDVVCSPEALPLVQGHNVEVVAESWDGWSCAVSRLASVEPKHPCACLVGSGIAPDDEDACGLIRQLLCDCEHPLVVDGGALAFVASEEGRACVVSRAAAGRTTIFTPHLGEAARLAKPLGLGVPAHEDDDSPNTEALFAQTLARAYEATVVLKGPVTYIADAQVPCRVYVMRAGTPALAKAGTGDVLAGIISSLVAQGLSAVDAATIGATLHAQAAREAAALLTDICVSTQDVIAHLPQAIGYFVN